jgi:hypothetical protein
MSDLKVRVFKHDSPQPATTVTVPGTVFRIAAGLIPRRGAAALRDEGIDLDEIIRLSTKRSGRLATPSAA